MPANAAGERIPTGGLVNEGPVWNAREGFLLWSDIVGDRISKWTPGQGITPFLDPSGHSNGLTYDRQGRLVAAGYGARSIWRLDPDGSIVVLASHYQGKKIHCPNDIVVKSDGSIYWTESTGGLFHPGMCGDDVQQYLDFKAVFRLSPDGSELTPVAMDFEGPNGIAFSPDESLLYVNDTRRRHIRAFDVLPDGMLADGRVFYEDRGQEPGVPDGMKVDVEGNVYCRASGGIHVISPTGKLLGRIRIAQITNLGWGDADWRTVYVTGHSDIYRFRLNVPGIPV